VRIVDCFVHPAAAPNEAGLFTVNAVSLAIDLPAISGVMSELKVERALLALFRPQSHADVRRIGGERFVATVLANFREQDALDQLRAMAAKGLRSITFHPYLQNMSRSDWPQAMSYAQDAARLGMFVCICTAYGSRDIYRVEVLPFATVVAEAVTCPVVLSHGGGAKVLDAMLVADAFPNVLLETSFSLTYWLGSSVEIDMAYAMRKLGAHRWLYGSDAPFIPMATALNDHLRFFERQGFAQGEVEAIMGDNARKYLEV
jgi:predicted TIM-barrel fold metal-dependent hydrolase